VQILMMLAIIAVAVTVMLAFAARAGIGRVRVVVGAVHQLRTGCRHA
jgi:hypothetical protein